MLNQKIIISGFLTLTIFINFPISGQEKINWDGYLQYRFTDNYTNQTNFSVRRAKFWLKGDMPSAENKWSYKLQANFLQQANFRFLLQDALIKYDINNFEITAGQFVPDFSIQRKQPDYVIPLTERADIINVLVPGAETMGRDIGVELKFKCKAGSESIGFFNGNGANTLSKQKNSLYVNNGSLFLLNNLASKLELSYSVSYRKANNLTFEKIFGNDFSYSGSDFRFGLGGILNINTFELQSEYIQADFGGLKAHGYYVLSDYFLTSKSIITLSVEQLTVPNSSVLNLPWYIVGYSYLIKRNDIKVSLDTKLQLDSKKPGALTNLQIQYFFN